MITLWRVRKVNLSYLALRQAYLGIILMLMLGVTSWALEPEKHALESPERQSGSRPLLLPNFPENSEINGEIRLFRHELHQRPLNLQTYTPHPPISISSNSQFGSAGFPGEGTIDDPYRIEGFNITDSVGPLISIKDTTVYFIISSNLLDGVTVASSGIRLSNVVNGIIDNNTVRNNGGLGIGLIDSDKNYLSANIVSNGAQDGISLGGSSSNIIVDNILSDHHGSGTFARGGMSIVFSSTNNAISRNTIQRNTIGIWMDISANHNTISNNTISHQTGQGLGMMNSINNTLANNSFSNNNGYAINLHSSASDNTIRWNSFFGNNHGASSQALDFGQDNVFLCNHWSDWITSDDDANGFVDVPYAIDGNTITYDPFPLVSQYPLSWIVEQHALSTPLVLVPSGGSISGIITIQWLAAVDLHGHSVTYDVYYSTGSDSAVWEPLATNLTDTHYDWDTTTVDDGSNGYWIMVNAMDGHGLMASATYKPPFSSQIQEELPDIPLELLGLGLLIGLGVLLALVMYRQQSKKRAPIAYSPMPPTTVQTSKKRVPAEPLPAIPVSEDTQQLFSVIQERVQELIIVQGERGPIVRIIPLSGLIPQIRVDIGEQRILMSGQLDPQDIQFDVNLEIVVEGEPRWRAVDDPWQGIILSGEEDLIHTVKHHEGLADKIAALGTTVIKVESSSPGVIDLRIVCNKSKYAITRAYALIEELQAFFDISRSTSSSS